jgi:hypothetical protein
MAVIASSACAPAMALMTRSAGSIAAAWPATGTAESSMASRRRPAPRPPVEQGRER